VNEMLANTPLGAAEMRAVFDGQRAAFLQAGPASPQERRADPTKLYPPSGRITNLMPKFSTRG
jgi:hypothetical protein